MPSLVNPYEELIRKHAELNGVPYNVAEGLARYESRFNPNAISPKGAQGIYQFMPETAKEWGVNDPFDPEQNISAGLKMLKTNYDKFGTWGAAIAAHNAGAGAVEKHGGIPPYPETQGLVKNVLSWGSPPATQAAEVPKEFPPGKPVGVAGVSNTDISKEPVVQQQEQFRTINVKGKGLVRFPANMSNKDIQAALIREFNPSLIKPEKSTFAEMEGIGIPEAANISTIKESEFGKGTGRVGTDVMKFLGGFASGVASNFQAAAIGSAEMNRAWQPDLSQFKDKQVAERLTKKWNEIRPSNPEDSTWYQWAKSIKKSGDSFVAKNPKDKETWDAAISEGLGSMFSFIVGSKLNIGGVAPEGFGAVEKLSQWARWGTDPKKYMAALEYVPFKLWPKIMKIPFNWSAALLGATSQAPEGFERAREKGASVEKATGAFKWNALIGLSEGAVVGKVFDRFNKATGGALSKAVFEVGKESAIGTLENMSQEAFQQIASNLVQKLSVDDKQKLSEGLGQAAGVGGAVGFITSFIATAAGLKFHPNTNVGKVQQYLDDIKTVSSYDAMSPEQLAAHPDKDNLKIQYEEAKARISEKMADAEREEKELVTGKPIPEQVQATIGSPLTSPPIPTGEATKTTGAKTEVLPQAPIERQIPELSQQIAAKRAQKAIAEINTNASPEQQNYLSWLNDQIQSMQEEGKPPTAAPQQQEGISSPSPSAEEEVSLPKESIEGPINPYSVGSEVTFKGPRGEVSGNVIRQGNDLFSGKPFVEVETPDGRTQDVNLDKIISSKVNKELTPFVSGRNVEGQEQTQLPRSEARKVAEGLIAAPYRSDADTTEWTVYGGIETPWTVRDLQTGENIYSPPSEREVSGEANKQLAGTMLGNALQEFNRVIKEGDSEETINRKNEDIADAEEWIKYEGTEPFTFAWTVEQSGLTNFLDVDTIRDAVLNKSISLADLQKAVESFGSGRSEAAEEYSPEDYRGQINIGKGGGSEGGNTDLYSFNPLAASQLTEDSVIGGTTLNGILDRFEKGEDLTGVIKQSIKENGLEVTEDYINPMKLYARILQKDPTKKKVLFDKAAKYYDDFNKIIQEELPEGSVAKGSSELYTFGGMFGRGFREKMERDRVFAGIYDEMPRYEIDDSKARLKGISFGGAEQRGTTLINALPPGETVKLEEVLDHPELFKNYPELKEVNVTRETPLLDLFKGTQGWFNPDDNTVNITPYAQDPLSTMLHELQHWIQYKEGFLRGGNQNLDLGKLAPGTLIRKLGRELYAESEGKIGRLEDAYDRRVAVVKTLESLSNRQKRKLNKYFAQMAELDEVYSRLYKQYPDQAIRVRSPEYQEYYKKMRKLKASIKDLAPGVYAHESTVEDTLNKYKEMIETDKQEINDAYTAINTIESGTEEALREIVAKHKGYELYRNFAGEIESREVQDRINMTPEEREAKPPFQEAPNPEEVIELYSFNPFANQEVQNQEKLPQESMHLYSFNPFYTTKQNIIDEKLRVLKGMEPGEIGYNVVSENMGWFKKIFTQGQWATKDDPNTFPTFKAGLYKMTLFNDGAYGSIKTLDPWSKLDKTERSMIDKVMFSFDERPYSEQGINVEPFIEGEDGGLTLNEEFYKQYRSWASKVFGSEALVETAVQMREGLDQDFANYYNVLKEHRQIIPSDVFTQAEARRRIPNYVPHVRKGDFVIAGYIDNPDGTTTKVVDKAIDLSHIIDPWAGKEGSRRQKKFGKVDPKTGEVKLGPIGRKLLVELKADPVIQQMGDIKWSIEGREHIPFNAFQQPMMAKALNTLMESAADKLDPKLGGALRKVMPAAVLDAIRETGMWTHMAKRAGVYGYEMENLGKLLYDYKIGLYANLSKMQVSQDLTNALMQIDVRKKNSVAWANQFVTDIMEPRGFADSAAALIKSFAFLKYLGLTVKPAVVNLSSTFTHGHSRLTAETGLGNAARYLTGAHIDLIRFFSGNKKVLSSDEIQLLDEMSREGTTQAQMMNEIRRSVGSAASAHKIFGNFYDAAAWPMKVTEENIRRSLALAGYRAAKDGKVRSERSLKLYQFEKGKKIDTPSDVQYQYMKAFAEELVEDAYSIFGKVNRPGVLRTGRVGKIASGSYTFKHFMHHTLSYMKWLGQQGAGGNRDATKALGSLVMSQVFLGGLAGVAGMGLWRKVYRELFPEQLKVAGEDPLLTTRKFAGDWLAYGMPSVLGVNIGQSYSIDAPGGIEDIIGVPYSLVKDFYYGGKALSSGDYERATEMMIPLKIARDILAAHRKSTVGFTTYSGGTISEPGKEGTGEPMKLSKKEAAFNMFGFQPIRLQKARDVKEIVDSIGSLQEGKQTSLANRYATAYQSDDQAAMEQVIDELSEWNDYWRDKGKPQYYIYPKALKQAIRGRLTGQKPKRQLRPLTVEIGKEMGFKK